VKKVSRKEGKKVRTKIEKKNPTGLDMGENFFAINISPLWG
jgi:hypothetical protein